MDIYIPVRIGGDSTQVLGYVQNLIESGTPFGGPRLNAPFGQQYGDFPLGPDLLNFTLLRLISLVTNEAVPTVTLFFLLTFALVAATSYWSLRGLGVSRPVAYFGAVVYAVVPFHFFRGTGHLFLSAYYAVPLAAYVLVTLTNGRALFGLGAVHSGPHRRIRLRPVATHVVLAVVVATTGIYYAVFTLILLVPAAVFGWIRSRSSRVVACAGLIGAAIAIVVALTMLPSFVSVVQNGPNADFPVRGAAETGRLQLRPLNLLMPVPGHFVGPLASLARSYSRSFPDTGENGESAGLIASLGLVLLAVVVLGSLVGALSKRLTWRRERSIGALVLVCLLIAMSGGASSLFALLVTPQIRAWGRFSIFVDFFALLAVAFVLSVAWRYLRRTRWRNAFAVALVAGVLLAALDQTGNTFVPNYDPIGQTYAADGAFTQQVEASLPAGAAIYQVPYRPYPEAGTIGDIPDYEPLRPYLQSDALRFSYGGEKGREAGWQDYVFDRQPAQVLPLLCLAGFSAVWVDRASYGLQQATSVADELQAALDVQPIVDLAERFAVYDMQPYCSAFQSGLETEWIDRLRDEVMRPIWPGWTSGSLPARIPQGVIIRDVLLPAELSLLNPADGGRSVTVSFNVAAIYPATATVAIEWPDGTAQTVANGGHVTRMLDLETGRSTIRFTGDDGPTGARQFLMTGFYALDSELLVVGNE